jgi:alkylhydroperoxidase family enzyme
MHARYKDQVQFLAVYVREAHPTDGWRLVSNDKVGISIKQPASFGERNQVAEKCCAALKMQMPLMVDTLDDYVGHLYSGMPDRLYVIDTAGRVVYQGGRGPFGFKPGELEQSLVMLLLDEKNHAPKQAGRFPIRQLADAWKVLPTALKGQGQPLPGWACMLAPSLPRTTAAMLELEYLHRVKSPLGQVLGAKMRWVAARANGCGYTRIQAEQDLLRAGLSQEQLTLFTQAGAGGAPREQVALTFARKLTVAADSVTDQEVEELIRQYGEKQVVAMVLLLAHASFQDRLLLSLGTDPDVDPPLPPVEFQFDPGAARANLKTLLRELPAQPAHDGDAGLSREWGIEEFGQLQAKMELQRDRKPRIRIPAWEEVRPSLPKGVQQPVRIKWSLVCMGYQPELTRGWFACMASFGQEARQDRVFEESLFWVVTRTLHCFY